MTEAKLRTSEIAAFAAPSLATTLLVTPIFSVLPSIYALNTTATLTEIGVVFIIARIIDAITDPLIGIASDRTTSRWGPRLPWMIAGAALALPSSYFLFLPPSDASATYFFITSSICLLAWTMITIPHAAWGAELSSDYDERSRIFAMTNFLARIGGFGFFLIPPALAPITGTTEIDMSTMGGLVIGLAVALPATITWLALKAPVRSPVAQAGDQATILASLRALVENKALLHFALVTLFTGVSVGMSGSLQLLYIQDFFKLGSYFFLISLLYGFAGLLTIPLWVYVAKRWGKHPTWGWSSIAGVVLSLPLLLLVPGPDALIPVLVILTLIGVMHGAAVMLPQAMLADIADYEALKSRVNAQGNYFSMLFLLSKVTTAVGAGAGFWIADVLGYVPNAASNPASSIILPALVIPAVLMIIGSIMILYSPISRRRHTIIARRLAQRRERAARDAAIPA